MCVNFLNEEPSFIFYPFTREDFDSGIEATLALRDINPLITGSIFGWNVHHAPLARNAKTGSLVARVTLTTRIRCSLEAANVTLSSSDVNSWPLLITPTGWLREEETSVSTHVLQQLDLNSHLLVTNIPGKVHFRYLHLVRRRARRDETNKREIVYVAVIGDTEANVQAREARPDVRCVRESGYCIRFTEVNKTTLDVTYDRSSQCESEKHAQELFVDWAEVACRWLQRITSSKLVQS
ncbi:hypothetical protein F444_09188, partial [Phytophthora nicotianae P1976]